jgi:two-component system, cell cycle sensor histidine kinase and response regulator CckA
VDVGELLAGMGPMLQRLVGEHIEFVLSLERGALRVKVDPTHLEQVLLNLVVNARDALDTGGRLTMQCHVVQVGAARPGAHAGLEPGRYVVIAVSDNGIGMDAETRTHVFEPFFTTKAAGRGTGLGLATVFGIVKQSGGNIYVDSEVGRGSTFLAYFPSSLEPLTELSPEPQFGLDAPGGVVLVAEDDPAVRSVVVTVLKRAGYSVLDAAGPLEALELARAYKGRIDLLLTDIVMPQLSGTELAERLTALWPKLSVVYMSGYTDRDITRLDRLDSQFLPKPITPVRLLDTIARVLNEGQASACSADGWELEARRNDAPARDQWARRPVP